MRFKKNTWNPSVLPFHIEKRKSILVFYLDSLLRKSKINLLFLERRSCHSAVMTAAGWISPVDKLIETGQIHIDDNDVYFNVGECWGKSEYKCVV